MAVEDRPRLVSLDRSSSWLTVSKALEMSTNTDTSLEDHKSEEYDRILFIMNDFKVQLLTVSLQPLHYSKAQPVYPAGQEHCSGS